MTVLSEGPKNAKIAIVGEAPGAEEVKEGKPFVGPAGKILDIALRQAGLTRDDCYITNLMQARPLGNDFGLFYQDPKTRRLPSPELVEGITRVLQELHAVKPNVVLLLGAEPLRALTGLRDIGARRGYVVRGEGGHKMLPTYHPAAVLHAGKDDAESRSLFPLFCFDVSKAKREARSPAYVTPKRTLLLRPTVEDVRHHITRLRASQEPVVFDIETTKGGKEWHCIAFSDSSDWAMCIPTSTQWGVDPEYVAEVRPLVQALLEDARVPKIAQNAQFDILFLRHHYGIQTRSLMLDTMTAHLTVYPELRKSLELMASLYTDQSYYKDLEKIPPSLWEYNALDAAVTYECYVALRLELAELGVWDFYQEYVLDLIHPLLDMQEQGVCVDLEQREIVAKQLREDLDDGQAELTQTAFGWGLIQRTPPELAGAHYIGLNPNSPKQLAEYLYTTLRLPRAYKRRSGLTTTDEDALERLSKKYGHPALALILQLRRAQKLLSTYVLAPLGDDARLRCAYVVGGTETGRLASRESMLGSGTNLQNVPKGVARRLLIPAPGLVFVQADLSQAEARIVAYLAEDDRLIDLFTRGGDIHRENAAHLFNVTVERVTDPQREVAKRLVHAANYGIGPTKFQEVLRNEAKMEVTKQEAERLLGLYHARFPKIQRWHAQVKQDLYKTRVLTSPVGRKRRFFGRGGEELLREAYAHVPQSTVADILNRGLIMLYGKLPNVDHAARLVLTVHDSVVVECRPTHVTPVAQLIKSCLERPVRIGHRTCLIPCDLKQGTNWADLGPLTDSGWIG